VTPAQRVLRAQLASNTRWANTEDRQAATASARQAYNDRWEKQVDPDQKLDPAERARRAAYAKKAHYASMAFKSAQVRAKRKSA
jgi:hypothetical protein